VEAEAGEKPRYRYHAKRPDADACVRDLAIAYENDRVQIVHQMNANALGATARFRDPGFSDAFRLRKGQDEGERAAECHDRRPRFPGRRRMYRDAQPPPRRSAPACQSRRR
jgi:hypothetical protein